MRPKFKIITTPEGVHYLVSTRKGSTLGVVSDRYFTPEGDWSFTRRDLHDIADLMRGLWYNKVDEEAEL